MADAGGNRAADRLIRLGRYGARSASGRVRLQLALSAVIFVLSGVVLGLMIAAPAAYHPAVRLATSAIFVMATVHLARSRRELLLSPGYLLGAVALVFFSLAPWLLLGALHPERFLRPANLAAVGRYADGQGELVILLFSLSALLATLLIGWWLGTEERPPGIGAQRRRPVSDEKVRLFAALSFVLLVGSLLPFALKKAGAYPVSGVAGATFQQIWEAAPAIMSFATAVLFFCAIGRNARWLAFALLGAALICAAVFSTHMMKIAVFITLAGAGAYFLRCELSLRRTVIMTALSFAFFSISLSVVSMTRPANGPDAEGHSGIYDHFVRKVLQRQAVTGGCLQEVIEKRAPDGRGSGVLYFVPAVVPRFLWPAKPDLSRGKEFAINYCEIKPENYLEKFPHSASISLLGEPIVENGWSGLAVAEGLLVVALSLVTLIAAGTGTLGAISLVAMLPWLADFDQHFALYFALSTKMFIWMVPLIVAYALLGRWAARQRETEPQS